MDLVQALTKDYQRFPVNQTYSLYTEDVYFQDPISRFRGLRRYQQMIGLMQTWFRDLHLELHAIQRTGNRVETQWTLSWTAILPWKPRIAITGWSELLLNEQGLIHSHVDYWHCSRWDVFTQHLPLSSQPRQTPPD
jgi:hypothetical protein